MIGLTVITQPEWIVEKVTIDVTPRRNLVNRYFDKIFSNGTGDVCRVFEDFVGRISTTSGTIYDPNEKLTLGVKSTIVDDVANKKKYVGVLPVSRDNNGYVEFLVDMIEDM